MALAAPPIPMGLIASRTSPGPPYGPLRSAPILVTPCSHALAANWRSLSVGECLDLSA